MRLSSGVLRVVTLLAACAVAAHADVTVVAPNSNTVANGNSPLFAVFGTGTHFPGAFQWDIAASQLTALVGSQLNAIGFRLPAGVSTVTTPTDVGQFNLVLSGSTNPMESLSSTRSNKIAANAVTVYNSDLTIPANGLIGGPGPNPFYLINFTTLFPYTGGDLLLTLMEANLTTLGVDANTLTAVSGIENTVGCIGFAPCQVGFFNAPVTELRGTAAAPEPSSIILIGTSLLLLGAGRFGRDGSSGPASKLWRIPGHCTISWFCAAYSRSSGWVSTTR